MQPHANMGIRQRGTKSKGFFYIKKRKEVAKEKEVPQDTPVAGVSPVLTELLRGKK